MLYHPPPDNTSGICHYNFSVFNTDRANQFRRIIHLNGFSQSELINYQYLIHSNAVLALTQLLNAMEPLKIEPVDIALVKTKLEIRIC